MFSSPFGAPIHPFDFLSPDPIQTIQGCVRTLQGVAEVKSALDRTYDLAKAGKPIAATDLVVSIVDRWIYDTKFNQVSFLLVYAETFRLPPESITGLLCVTFPVKQVLGKARVDFFDRSMLALTEVSHWSEESIQAVTLRLK